MVTGKGTRPGVNTGDQRRHGGPGQCLVALLAALAAAVVTPAVSRSQDAGHEPQYQGSMGWVTVGSQQAYRLALRPELTAGPWAAALDLELLLDANGGVKATGWQFGTGAAAANSLLRKVYYVRYGKPDGPTFVKLGALDDVSLGYGLIVSGYRNTVEYPGVKKTGLQFALHRVGGSVVAIEGLVGNVQDLEHGGGLMALRVSRPVVGNLEVGVTGAVDLNQYAGLLDSDGDGYPDVNDAFPTQKDQSLDNDGDGVADDRDSDDDNDGGIDIDSGSGLSTAAVDALLDLQQRYGDDSLPLDATVERVIPFNRDQVRRDRFGMVGLDANLPLLKQRRGLDLRLYGQMAVLIDDGDGMSATEAARQGVVPGNRRAHGWGAAAPGLALTAGPVNGQLELRHFRGDFRAAYFDNLYEVDRVRINEATGQAQSKDATLTRDQAVSGVFGRAGADLLGLVEASGSYQYLAGAKRPEQQLTGSARLAERLAAQVPHLTQARAYYQKANIGTRLDRDGTPGSHDGFFEPSEDTFYGYLIGCRMSGGVSLVWDHRYVYARGSDQRLERHRLMTIETVFDF
jgi:hypothetical protein